MPPRIRSDRSPFQQAFQSFHGTHGLVFSRPPRPRILNGYMMSALIQQRCLAPGGPTHLSREHLGCAPLIFDREVPCASTRLLCNMSRFPYTANIVLLAPYMRFSAHALAPDAPPALHPLRRARNETHKGQFLDRFPLMILVTRFYVLEYTLTFLDKRIGTIGRATRNHFPSPRRSKYYSCDFSTNFSITSITTGSQNGSISLVRLLEPPPWRSKIA